MSRTTKLPSNSRVVECSGSGQGQIVVGSQEGETRTECWCGARGGGVKYNGAVRVEQPSYSKPAMSSTVV